MQTVGEGVTVMVAGVGVCVAQGLDVGVGVCGSAVGTSGQGVRVRAGVSRRPDCCPALVVKGQMISPNRMSVKMESGFMDSTCCVLNNGRLLLSYTVMVWVINV